MEPLGPIVIEPMGSIVKTRLMLLKVVLSLLSAQWTEFVPDEYWQSTEVASYLHSGKGHLTWEWAHGLRSYIIPVLISWIYKVLSLFGLDYSPRFLTIIPQALQLALSVYGYSMFHCYAEKKLGNSSATFASTFMLINWFTTFCAARLIINQTEMSLNMIALGLLSMGHWKRFSAVIGLNFIIRPTAPIFWVPFIPEVVRGMIKTGNTWWEKYSKVVLSSAVLFLVIALGGLFDYAMTGTLSWWEFLKFNFLEKGNAEFGVHSRFWYFNNAMPSILGPAFIMLILGIFMRGEVERMTWYTVFYLIVYSLLDHKEIRFLLPVVPLMCCILGDIFTQLFRMYYYRGVRSNNMRPLKIWKKIMWIYFALNTATAMYIGSWHQCGIRPSARFIHRRISKMENPNVWILTPCYSVPVHTLMPHPNVNFEYYVCAPKRFHHLYEGTGQLFQRNGFGTVDLAEDITMKLNATSPPDFVLGFYPTVKTISKALLKNGLTYAPCGLHRHTHVGLDVARFVAVLCSYNPPEFEVRRRLNKMGTRVNEMRNTKLS